MRKLLAVLTVCAFAVACAKPPLAEMDAANEATAQVETNPDVLDYAPASLAKVKNMQTRMLGEAEAKNYGAAKNLANETKAAAEQALRDAAAAKEQAKAEAASLVDASKKTLAETEATLMSAKNVRGIALDFKAVQSGLNALHDSINAAENDLNSQKYKTSITLSQKNLNKLSEISNQISDAVRATSKKK